MVRGVVPVRARVLLDSDFGVCDSVRRARRGRRTVPHELPQQGPGSDGRKCPASVAVLQRCPCLCRASNSSAGNRDRLSLAGVLVRRAGSLHVIVGFTAGLAWEVPGLVRVP